MAKDTTNPGDLPPGDPPPAAAIVAAGSLTESDAAELVRLRSEKEELGRRLSESETKREELERARTAAAAPAPRRGFLEALAEWFPR